MTRPVPPASAQVRSHGKPLGETLTLVPTQLTATHHSKHSLNLLCGRGRSPAMHLCGVVCRRCTRLLALPFLPERRMISVCRVRAFLNPSREDKLCQYHKAFAPSYPS